MSSEFEPSLDVFASALLKRKALSPVILDVRDLTSIADAFLICSGRSNRQVSAIAASVKRDLKKLGIKPLNIEGEREGHWILLDYCHVIIHIFYEPMRDFYDLEGLWIDANRIHIESLIPGSEIRKETDTHE